MKAPQPRAGQDTREPPEVGDHLALDLLNTEARSQGQVVDFWASNTDVHRWLVRHGIADASRRPPPNLLARGRALRAAVREAVSARKAGGPIAVDALDELNEHLRSYPTTPLLSTDAGKVTLTRVSRGDATSSMLGPVAEAAASLLAEEDFSLVKQCEHPDCILWFYDRTKSHKRRWCSMARCGNRIKAAQFRKRSSAA